MACTLIAKATNTVATTTATTQIGLAAMALIKESKRTKREACKRCGDTGPFYWAKDSEVPAGAPGHYVLIHKTPATLAAAKGDTVSWDTLHVCGTANTDPVADDDESDNGSEVKQDTAAPTVPAVPATMPAGSGDALLQLQQVMQSILGTPQIDRSEVERIARDVVNGVVYPTKTVVIREDMRREVEGLSHNQLGEVVTAMASGEHVMMVGPAGSGKSHLAEQAAESLGRAFYSMSLTAQTPESRFVGYLDAKGDYHAPVFRQAYEHGGVICVDEVDNGNANILGVMNAALANSRMSFPDGMVKRHDDFAVFATANTFGRGATRAYVGRNQLDAAFLDRFTMIDVQYDEALETALCTGTGASAATVDKVTSYVRKLRRNAESHGLNVILSPRATVGMCKLIVAGFEFDRAVDARVRRGLADDVWSKLTA